MTPGRPTAADRILAASLRDGGGTFLPDGTPWRDARPDHRSHAYAVAVRGIARDNERDLSSAIRDVRDNLRTGEYIGTWRDSATGQWYVDLVRILYSRSHAIALGRRYAQVAIYDLTAGEEVRL